VAVPLRLLGRRVRLGQSPQPNAAGNEQLQGGRNVPPL
jgi:hypothetical protein